MQPTENRSAFVAQAPGGKQAWLVSGLWICALLVCMVLTGANLYFGDLNQDEGWYLYTARLVHEGQVPYRDFAFTQGPVMAYAYSLSHPVVEAFGLAGGRLVTALLGFAAALCAALLAGNMVVSGRKRAAVLLGFILVAVNVYQSYFCTIVKTYSLCALLIVLGFLCIVRANRRHGAFWAMASGLFLVFAAGTRISAGVILPIVFLFLLLGRRSTGRAWFWFGLGSALAACAVFLPFLVVAKENFIYWVVQYHTGRTTGGIAAQAVYKAGFISRVVQGYFVAAGLFVAWLIARMFRMGGVAEDIAPTVTEADAAIPENASISARMLGGMVWGSVAAVSLVHLSAPFPYDDYQAAIFPLFAAALACGLAMIPKSEKAVSWMLLTVFLLSMAAAFSSTINQSWFVGQRDRIWWRLKSESSLETFRKAGARIRALAGPDQCLLTQDTYLAVESGLRVPHGLEMGPFSYYPEFDADTAARRHVLNAEMFRELLKNTDASVAAISGYGLAIKSPGVVEVKKDEYGELWNIVTERFKLDLPVVKAFGQDLTELRIMVRSEATGNAENSGIEDPIVKGKADEGHEK